MKLLILRPQPGAAATAAGAAAKGLQPVIAPIFTVRPLDWDAPDPAGIEAVLLTSANAVRHAGEQLDAFVDLPCYTVGDATAQAARAAGFTQVREGPSDGRALIGLMVGDGIVHALHLSGRDHVGLEHPSIALTRRLVYAAEPVERLPAEARAAIEDGALVLIHSPRAGALLGRLVDAAGLGRDSLRIAAISAAAGAGWPHCHIAAEPRDQALLELAAKLCHIEGEEMGKSG